MVMSPSGERILVQRCSRLMATEVSVQLATEAERRDDAERAADAVMAWMAEVERTLTRFSPESELSRLNASAGEWFAASELLYACVERALAAARASGGLFDPALLPRMEAWGYDRDFAEIAHRELGAMGRLESPAGSWREIEVNAEERRIRLPQGVRLDLGGIAKGWAADVALDLHCASFAGALINVGGDLRLRGGPQPGVGWSIGLRDPHGEDVSANSGLYPDLAAITFSRGGLATSGAVRRWWLRDGVRVHHLLDPRTGAPTRVWTGETDTADAQGTPMIATATALASTAARAEVAAKVALLRGYPACLRAVESAWASQGPVGSAAENVDNGVALALVLANGEVVTSGNIVEWLATLGTEGAPLYLNATSGGEPR
jgi:thiamine biosynthesis lipoprotein